MDEADLARFVEDVLIALANVRDHAGLKIRLPSDYQIAVLAAAITAVNNGRHDRALFRPITIMRDGSVDFGG